MHDLFEDDRVNILAQHVEQEPVAHLGLLHNDVDALFLDEPKSDVEKVGSHPWREDDRDAIDDDERCEQHEEHHPEPQEDVDLFVDNVQREDAHGIVLLYLP